MDINELNKEILQISLNGYYESLEKIDSSPSVKICYY